MELKYNLTGADRKRLVKAISEITNVPAKYLGAPSFAYQIDYFTVTREGSIVFNDMADSEEIEKLMEALAQRGFVAERSEYDEPMPDIEIEEVPEDCPPPYGTTATAPTELCVSMPRSLFTDTAIANLEALVAAKGRLFKKALGVDDLPIEITDEKVSFPWFNCIGSAEEATAYEIFICRLCEMARNQKRITAKERDTDNDKYAFRCFLLRLGFIGAEHKQERKILLRNLTGSSAFKSAPNKEVPSDALSE